jgi:glycerol-3-phosphate dehydrogenase (NAD(P)+)
MAFDRIAVLGAGAWGTALANVVARAGRDVTLWSRDPQATAELAKTRINPRLPGVALDKAVTVTDDIAAAGRSDAVLIVVPSQIVRTIALAIAPVAKGGTAVIVCAKGIERGSGKFLTDVIGECAPRTVPAILSGPSFAADVARGLPTAVTIAAREEKDAAALAGALGSATFRLYHSTDVRGVEIGGAAKNVLAIAAGIVTGRKLGASAAAALVTRGFAELFRFGKAFGARPETLTGLAGLGDLILTCSTPQSRNFSLGIALGEGRTPDEARKTILSEGFDTAPVLVELARTKKIEMPISSAIAGVLDGRLTVEAAIESLLARPFKAEH